MLADGFYAGTKNRRWQVDWSLTPQPIQVKVSYLRGIKDKVPAGDYAVRLSMYERLSGRQLRWSRLRGQHWCGSTLPTYHDGKYFSHDINVKQSVLTGCPAQPQIKPGMVLVFELVLLRGEATPLYRTVGW